MDLLKDITRELRGDDGSGRSDGHSDRAPRAESASETGGSTASGDPSDGGSAGGDASDRTNRRSRADTHVCSFCETEFDADRRACPKCDAEIVLRGDR